MLAFASCLAACGGGAGEPDATVFDGSPVGHQCISGVSDPSAPNSYNQPAAECPEDHICLHIQDTQRDLCTAACQDEMGCAKVIDSPCMTFACVPVFDVGDHACEKLCVCADYVPDPDAGFGVFCP